MCFISRRLKLGGVITSLCYRRAADSWDNVSAQFLSLNLLKTSCVWCLWWLLDLTLSTVAEKGHPLPPTATMNRARLILNARGKDIKHARLSWVRARLTEEPPTNFLISLHKVKGQSIMSCSLHRCQGIPWIQIWPLTLCRLILKPALCLTARAVRLLPRADTRNSRARLLSLPRAFKIKGARRRRVTLLGHRTYQHIAI